MLLDLRLKEWKLKQELQDEDYVDDSAYDENYVSAKAKQSAWARLIKKVYKVDLMDRDVRMQQRTWMCIICCRH